MARLDCHQMCVNGKTNPENDTRPVAVYGIWIRRSFHYEAFRFSTAFTHW